MSTDPTQSSESDRPPAPKRQSVPVRLRRRLTSWGVHGGAIIGLVALAIMVLGTLYPKPLLVIASMSLGHALGILAGLCYLAAILNDIGAKKN